MWQNYVSRMYSFMYFYLMCIFIPCLQLQSQELSAPKKGDIGERGVNSNMARKSKSVRTAASKRACHHKKSGRHQRRQYRNNKSRFLLSSDATLAGLEPLFCKSVRNVAKVI